MLRTWRMAAKALAATAVIVCAGGMVPAQAATAPASAAVIAAEKSQAPAASANEVIKVGHARLYRYGHWPRRHWHRYPYYRPYFYHRPACGWRKRCWYNDWGDRRCRWVNTCRSYY